MKKRIGVFGGTFDPPHIGHQILAMEAYDQLKLDVLYWVLSPQPPHKIGKNIAPTHIRKKMVKEAIRNDKIFRFSSVDIDREGPHYVLDTMIIFRQKFPEENIFFIMGGDSLRHLPSWYKPDEFLSFCDKIAVMHRKGERIKMKLLEKELPGISNKVEFIEAPILEISSNLIRDLIALEKPYRYYLPPAVYEIVQQKGLYKNK